ncbi:MAG: DUF5106 domain-containing protein [Flavobacteriales bacterium]|nr:DUF5106 domain-containing protein [Flavobacteriales bacterium]
MQRNNPRQLILTFSLCLVAAFSFIGCESNLPGHKIKIKVTGVNDTICFLANYYGTKQYYKDTAVVNEDGYAVFEGTDTLPGGVYSIILPGTRYFEFIIDDQHFTLETDTADYVSNMKVTGSKDNELFYKYLNLIKVKQVESKEIKDRITALEETHDSTAIYNEMLVNIDTKVNDIRNDIIDEGGDMFVSAMFKTMRDPVIPDFLLLSNGRRDSIAEFNYYKSHFLDEVDLSDTRLLRSPVLHKRVIRYLDNVMIQKPDSLIKAIDLILEKTNGNYDTFKYFTSYLTNHYEKSKIMGMEAIFVHMAFKYYLTGQADWVDSTQLSKIEERATILRPLLLGNRVENLVLKDAIGMHRSIYEIKSDFTVLWFWDPDCGHCKEATPVLNDIYNKHSRKDFEVYAVGIMEEEGLEKWQDFIDANNLNWINVNDIERKVDLRKKYDIYSTPVLFLLDKNKEIMAKRVTVESLGEILEQVIAQEAAEKSN